MKLSEALQGYVIASLADGLSSLTVNGYRASLVKLIEYLGDKEVAQVTTDDLRSFMNYLSNGYVPKRINNENNKDPLSSSSHHRYWKSVRSFFKWAEKDLDCGRPDKVIKMPSWQNEEVIPLSEEDIRKLLSACEYADVPASENRKAYRFRKPNALRDRAIILLLLDTGVRAGELSRLRVSDANLENGEVYVRAWHVRKTKARTTFLGRAAKKALWRYLVERGKLRPDDLLFVTQTNQPMNRARLLSMVSDLGDRVGIDKVHPHRFRHTFAVQYLRNGGDIFTLKRLLGHSSMEMVNHYLGLVQEDIQAAHQAASPVDRWRL